MGNKFFSGFCHVFSLQPVLETKITVFSVLLLCKKCSFGLPGARKQREKQCFSGSGSCCHFRKGDVWRGGQPLAWLWLPPGPALHWAGIPELAFSALWDSAQHELAASSSGQAQMPLERCCSERLEQGNSWVWGKVSCLIVPIRILYFKYDCLGPNVVAVVSSF